MVVKAAVAQLGGAFLALFASAAAASSDWVYVMTESGGFRVFVDSHSIKRDANVTTFWDKTELPDGRIKLLYISVDCRRDLWSPISFQMRDASGEVTESATAPETLRHRPIPPDSVISAQRDLVCGE